MNDCYRSADRFLNSSDANALKQVTPYAFLAVGLGAALGAWLRYALNVVLNPVTTLPLGTLAANLGGGLFAGVALAAFSRPGAVTPELRLFITTGFLGGLTTFSAFSAETAALLLRQQYGLMTLNVMANVAGSLAMTLLGFYLFRTLR